MMDFQIVDSGIDDLKQYLEKLARDEKTILVSVNNRITFQLRKKYGDDVAISYGKIKNYIRGRDLTGWTIHFHSFFSQANINLEFLGYLESRGINVVATTPKVIYPSERMEELEKFLKPYKEKYPEYYI